MNANRYFAIFASIAIVIVLVCGLTNALVPAIAQSPAHLQESLTPTAFVYLPLVVKPHSHVAATPTTTPCSTATPTATPTNTPPPTATPTATPPPGPLPGHWVGTTNLGHPMSFDVSEDSAQWSNFTLKTSGQVGPCSVTITTTVNGPRPITNNEFSWASSTYSFNGHFTSSDTANGVYAYTNYYIYGCGYFNQTGEWTANKP